MITTCIIPARNAASTIERAVKSAIDAGCNPVYVFDDASTDDTKKIVHQFLGYGNVGLSSSDFHVGVNYARNYLISRAGDDSLIIPLDADDCLCNITPLLNAYEPGTFVYGDYNQVTGNDVQRIKGAPAGTLARKNITGVTFLFSKADWIRCGGYNPNYAFAEDFAFQCNLVHHGIRPKYVEAVVYDRYVHETGNPRTALATEYWAFYLQMCKRDYPLAFQSA